MTNTEETPAVLAGLHECEIDAGYAYGPPSLIWGKYDPEFERLLAAEQEIDNRTQQPCESCHGEPPLYPVSFDDGVTFYVCADCR